MTAAVWYVGGPDPDDRLELRHSLRSVAVNAPVIDEAWVVGDVPDWFAGVKVPLEPQPEKFANARQSITRFVNLPAAPAEFYLFMDDVFVTEPVVGRLPVCHLGPVANFSAYKTGTGTYADAVRQTADWLAEHGHPDPLAYLGHTPVPLDTARVREFLDTYPADRRLEPFLLYVVAGTDGPGTRQGNAKCAAEDGFVHKRDLPIPFLSSNPDTWTGQVGRYIRGLFTEPCKFERG
jgi:hypothetical protein